MESFPKCPVCGRELLEKNVEKLLRGGVNTAVVNVKAEVCLHCGERLYSKKTIEYFEQIRSKLTDQDTFDFQQVGKSFKVAC